MFGMILVAAAVQAAPVSPAPVAPATNWQVAPVAYGTWSWRPLPGGSEALFQDAAGPQLIIRCTLASRTVSLVRTGAIGGAPIVVRTTSAERTLPATATLGARDPLLDDVAFSRGRISVEVAGAARLIVPSWPESARAIEDCRN